jgi:hypothetical protein
MATGAVTIATIIAMAIYHSLSLCYIVKIARLRSCLLKWNIKMEGLTVQ